MDVVSSLGPLSIVGFCRTVCSDQVFLNVVGPDKHGWYATSLRQLYYCTITILNVQESQGGEPRRVEEETCTKRELLSGVLALLQREEEMFRSLQEVVNQLANQPANDGVVLPQGISDVFVEIL